MTKYMAAVFALVAGAATVWAGWPCAAADTTVYKVEAAVTAGKLSPDEGLMYKFMGLYAAFEDKIPAAYRGEWYAPAPETCGTPVVMELLRRWPGMDPAVKRKLQEECGLGQTVESLFDAFRECYWGNSGYGGIPVHTYDTPQGHYKIHYVLTGANGLQNIEDLNGNGYPDMVEFMGADLETAFAAYDATDWFYHPDPEEQKYLPLKDYYPELEWPEEGNDYGGDDRCDAYLGALGGGIGGITYPDQPFPETERSDYSSYMNLRNLYQSSPQGGWGEQGITAHELAHVVQFMYDTGTASWYMEASAMWCEDLVIPGATDPIGRAGTYLGNPLVSIDSTGDGGYIACILNYFWRDWCTRSWNPPAWNRPSDNLVPREIWRAVTVGDAWYTGEEGLHRGVFEAFGFIVGYYNVGKVYVPGREFPEAYDTFTEWNFFTGDRDDSQHYQYHFSSVGFGNTWNAGEYPVNWEPPAGQRMNHLASGYYLFHGYPSWTGAVLKFEGDEENPEPTKDWGGYVFVNTTGNTWTDLHGHAGVGEPMFTPNDKGILYVGNPSQYPGICMSINNTTYSGSNLGFVYSFTSTEDTTDPVCGVGIVRPEAAPDYLMFILGANEPLFGVPEATGFFTPDGGEMRAEAITMDGEGSASFVGPLILEQGESGSGEIDWKAADEAGHVVSGKVDFSAGFVAQGGGTVGNAAASVRVPAGTLGKATLLSIVPKLEARTGTATATTLGGDAATAPVTLGTAYEYGPSWAALAKPVEVVLSYEGLEVEREDRLSVYRWTGTAWEDLGGTIDRRNHRVLAVSDRMGTFTLGYGEVKGTGRTPGKPMAFNLYQNYPNPARGETVIKYTLPAAGRVALTVYDLAGRKVATVVDDSRPAGAHEERYALTAGDGRPLAPGVYVYRLTAGTDVATKRMVVAR